MYIMHIVRRMKKYGDIRVANAMYACGWRWKRRPKNIDRLVEGIPHCKLEEILAELDRAATVTHDRG